MNVDRGHFEAIPWQKQFAARRDALSEVFAAGGLGSVNVLDRRNGVNPAQDALNAVQRLAGAATAQIGIYHRAGNLLEITASAPALDGYEDAVVVSDMIECAQRLTSLRGQHCWIEDEEDSGAALLVQLDDRSSSLFLLILRFRSVSPAARQRLERMAPDLAMLIKLLLDQEGRLEEVSDRTAATATALDHGECGVIAVRSDHSIVFANTAAKAMLDEERGLHLRRGMVRPTDYQSGARFYAALEAAIAPLKPELPASPRAFVMLLPSGSELRPMIVVVTPGSGAPDVDEVDPIAIVYLLQAGHGTAQGLETLCQLLGLSRVETRLMTHLYAGRTVSEAASQMRIKVETARAYLKQIFAKTDTHRQSDLVSLMARYLRAVRGNFDFHPA